MTFEQQLRELEAQATDGSDVDRMDACRELDCLLMDRVPEIATLVEAARQAAAQENCGIGFVIGSDPDHTCYECERVLKLRAALAALDPSESLHTFSTLKSETA